jgi:hypothetical protein
MLCWVILAFTPKRGTIVVPLFYGGVGLLALTYAILIVGLLGQNLFVDLQLCNQPLDCMPPSPRRCAVLSG